MRRHSKLIDSSRFEIVVVQVHIDSEWRSIRFTVKCVTRDLVRLGRYVCGVRLPSPVEEESK